MNIIELQALLSQIKKVKISQSDIALALGVTRSDISQKAKKDSVIPDKDIKKIEEFFDVSLTECLEKESDDFSFETMKRKYDLDEKDVEFMQFLLTSTTERKFAYFFFEALKGNEDALEIITRLLNNPLLSKQLLKNLDNF